MDRRTGCDRDRGGDNGTPSPPAAGARDRAARAHAGMGVRPPARAAKPELVARRAIPTRQILNAALVTSTAGRRREFSWGAAVRHARIYSARQHGGRRTEPD